MVRHKTSLSEFKIKIIPSIFSSPTVPHGMWDLSFLTQPGMESVSPAVALAWPPRLSAGRRESGSQGPWLGEAAPQPESWQADGRVTMESPVYSGQ